MIFFFVATRQIEKAKEKADLPLPRKERLEMETKKTDMQAELKKWRKFLEMADDALTHLENEVKAHLNEYNRKLKYGVGFAAAGATGR